MTTSSPSTSRPRADAIEAPRGNHRRSPGRASRGRRDRTTRSAATSPTRARRSPPQPSRRLSRRSLTTCRTALALPPRRNSRTSRTRTKSSRRSRSGSGDAKATLKEKTAELEFKLELKRLGAGDFKAETQALIAQADARLAGLDPKKKAGKKTITALDKDKEALSARLARTDAALKAIGGQISEADARRLILKKIYDIARAELDRYLNAEKRVLVRAVENLWEKYSVSSRELEKARGKTLKELDGFLEGLGYFR